MNEFKCGKMREMRENAGKTLSNLALYLIYTLLLIFYRQCKVQMT